MGGGGAPEAGPWVRERSARAVVEWERWYVMLVFDFAAVRFRCYFFMLLLILVLLVLFVVLFDIGVKLPMKLNSRLIDRS